MSLDRRRLADLLLAAFEQPDEERHAFLERACAGDAELLEEALACLAVEDDLGDFLEPPPGVPVAAPPGAPVADTPVAGTPVAGTPVAGTPVAGTPVGDGPAAEVPAADRLGATLTLSDSLLETDPGLGPRSPGRPASGPGAADEGPGSAPPEDGWRRKLGRRRLGAYRILGDVGAGGMGEVYVGEDTRLGRRVAVKTLPQAMADRSAWLRRFEREAQVLASLNHPNIVTIHSVEEDDGVRFLTMELVDGKTLRESIPEGGLSPDDFFHVASGLTEALAAAHERGVIHRDLKPANVMVTADSRVKVLDFGLAKDASRSDHALSQDGAVMGTVPYMAPEQIRGEPADARSDLFALGVVLYQMATGRHPFPAKGAVRTAQAILEDEPPLDAVREKLGDGVGAIVARCLKKRPKDRYRDSGEVRDELTRLREERLAEKILESREDLRPEALAGPAARRPRWAFLAAGAAALVALALAFGGPWSRSPQSTPAGETGGRPRTSLAVLPFGNLTGDPEVEWLSTGIPELLVTDLAQSPELVLLDGGEVRRIQQRLAAAGETPPSAEAVRRAARDAGVDAVVRGSFARFGSVLRIAYTIEDPAAAATLRSASLEGEGEESLFELVDRLSAAVRASFEATRPDLAPAGVEETTTASLAAWQAYTEAQALYHEQSSPEAAIARLEEALRIDPDFALASVNIAKMHQSLGHNAEAQAYAERAFGLMERLPLNTRFNAEAGYYGTRWATTGRAIETYDLALKVYPDNSSWRNNLARRYAFFERYPEAIQEFRKLIDSGAAFWGDYHGAANAHAALGDFETGHELLAAFAEEHPDHWLLRYSQAWHLTEWGKYEEAAEAFERVAELRSDTPNLHYGRWRLEVLRGDFQAAEREARRLLAFDDSFALWRGHMALAQAALYHGRSQEARRRFDAAVDASTGADRALARCFAAELMLAMDDGGRALEEASLAQEEGRHHWPELRGFYVAALAEQALGRPDAADALRETLWERWRRQPNAVEERQLHQLSGLLALARGDGEAGVAALERAAALLPASGVEFSWHVFPAHVPIWTALGEAELARGRPAAALGWLSRATASGSEHLERPVPWVRGFYLSGVARLRLGELEAARRDFETFLAWWGEGDLDRRSVAAARAELAHPIR